jgi:uncharacterized repeat protein (TIGR01451 family)
MIRRFLLSLVPLLLSGTAAAQCVSLTTLGAASTQNFDTLAGAGTNVAWADNSTIPGWYSTRTTYNAGTGASNAGALYSFGSAAVPADRALGGIGSGGTGTFYWAACFTNNTGSTLTSVDVSYFGEQWRDGGAATPVAHTMAVEYQAVAAGTITDADTPTTGWTAHTALDFASPTFVNTGAGALADGNAAGNRTFESSSISVSVPAGNQFWIRWRDVNDGGNDHALAVDQFSITPQGGAGVPTLNISDVTLAEGNPPGTTTHTFAVTLSAPAGPGGVTFDIASADGTAQDDNPATEDNDYVAQSLTGQNIPMGSTGPYNFSVTVNRDTTTEPNETFFVNVSNITGANAGDVQGQGTINNDDITLTPIHDIQGPGASSPIVGASVTTTGIVTGVRGNGFFLQEPDASVDADPATSEGVFVFTSGAPPAAAVVGALVQVTATVVEFVPPSDSLQPPLTELSSPTVVQLSTGNPLPVAIPLTATFPDPAGPHDQLERLEGMRAAVASLTVGEATDGSLTETSATATSIGVFQGTLTGVPRAFREPGIPAPDPAPSGGGTIPPIPRFDSNPEVLRVDSDGLVGGPLLDVNAGAVVTGLVGPLDYAFRRYTLLQDPGVLPAVAGGATPTLVAAPTAQEATIAAYNLQRFYDTVNNGLGEPVLTAAAFDARLAKASLAIRNHLRAPDVVATIEVENLATLQALAARISSDAIAAAQPDPDYDAFLVEGNGPDGIDVGFLVKTALVFGATPRVTVNAVVQELDGTLLVNPDASTDTLHDRPPLRLDAVVNSAGGGTWAVTVIANHLRSLNGANSEVAGSNGWATEGARIRAKRQQQAQDLANLVQARQVADPGERIVLLGDFNAFEFNDGLGDSINTIAGTPVPDNETAVPGDGIDLVNPDLDNLGDTAPAAERYSFVFAGSAQTLDHVLVNQALASATPAPRLEHARINADFAETARNNAATAVRLSDHDPVVAYFAIGTPGVLEFSAANYDVGEATTTFNVTVNRSGGTSGAVDVSYAIAAGSADPADFTAATGTVSFADGETSKTFPVTIVNDAIDEPDQTIALSLSNPTNGSTLGAQATATITIQDDDAAPTITIGDLTQDEGNSGTPAATLAATLSGASEFTVTVDWALAAGTAQATDFTAASGTLTFAPGTTSQPIAAAITGEAIFETNETVLVDLTNAVNASIADPQGVITIANDDAAPTITITDLMHPEGTGGTSQATLVATLSGPTEVAATLSWTLDAGTALCCGVDFSGPDGTLTFPVGITTRNISATIFGDAIDEPNETVLVNLTSATNATIADNQGVITIVDDDGVPQLVINDLSVAEGNAGTSAASLTVTLVGSTAQTVTVDYAFGAGTASGGGNDFTATGGTLTFAPGTPTQTVPVTLVGDLRHEANESVLVDLSNATNATIGDAQGVLTIGNDDAAPVFTIGDISVTEGNAGSANATLTVTKTGLTDLAASVDFATAPGSATAGSDYTSAAGTLAFPAATTTQQIVVPVQGDATAEPDETVQVNLANATGATLGDAQALLTILNDDVASLPQVTGTKTVSGQFVPGGSVTYTIVLSNAGNAAQGDNPGNEFTDVLPAPLQLFSATASSGTAVATLATNTVGWNGSIAAGASVTITIVATIPANAVPGTMVTNIGSIATDADNNGSNETTRSTDDPATPAGGDGTGFAIQGGAGVTQAVVVPGLDAIGKGVLALLLALLALGSLRQGALRRD